MLSFKNIKQCLYDAYQISTQICIRVYIWKKIISASLIRFSTINLYYLLMYKIFLISNQIFQRTTLSRKFKKIFYDNIYFFSIQTLLLLCGLMPSVKLLITTCANVSLSHLSRYHLDLHVHFNWKFQTYTKCIYHIFLGS